MPIELTGPLTTNIQCRPLFSSYTFVSGGERGTPCAELAVLDAPAITPITGKSRSLPSLPAEIHLEVIDAIARRVPQSLYPDDPGDPADRNALCTCALVCKFWLNTARFGIWTGVRLSSRKKGMSFVRLLRAYMQDSGGGRPTWTIPSFGRYVAHLSIRETRGNAWDPKWLDGALPYLAAHLSRIQRLEMEQITWEYLSSDSRATCLQEFKCVRSLTLRGFVFHTTRDMCDFLGEFTELEVLTLDGIRCAKNNTPTWFFNATVDEESVIKPPPRRLNEVGVRDAPMETVFKWIIASFKGQRGGIQTVRIGGVGLSEASAVGGFLKSVGQSLRKVHIGFETDFVERGDALVREMALGENKSLEEVHIFGLVVPSPPPVDPFEREARPPRRALAALTSLLSQIRSQMRVLSLALYPADVRAMLAVDFNGLAAVFDQRVWSQLEEVRVVISNKGEHGLGKVVRERLGMLQERGVLQVQVGFDEREVLY